MTEQTVRELIDSKLFSASTTYWYDTLWFLEHTDRGGRSVCIETCIDSLPLSFLYDNLTKFERELVNDRFPDYWNKSTSWDRSAQDYFFEVIKMLRNEW